ncbi:MAG: 23S rRNA (adenine(2503)-C(2))-methyltransferase RlmN [bacterium]|jgi:23S rRNA (adenine2503-C2)-methyltransferase
MIIDSPQQKSTGMSISAIGITPESWRAYFDSIGEPKYRAKQAFAAVHAEKIDSWSGASTLPKPLRNRLEFEAPIVHLKLLREAKSADNTVKLLFEPEPGSLIETVLIPTRYGPALCMSSQIGCPVGCLFCQTGQMGLGRNLATEEIVSQFMQAEKYAGGELHSVIMMGMGEPMLNVEAVSNALAILTHPKGRHFSARRITVSTVGYPARIREMAERGWKYNLALSLHATNEATRNRLIPVSSKQPMSEIFEALESYQMASKSEITLEYILLDGINTSPHDARALAHLSRWGWRAEIEDEKWLKGFFARGARGAPFTRDSWKVNLIPYNPTSPNAKTLKRLAGSPASQSPAAGPWTLRCPSDADMEAFAALVDRLGARVTLRKPRGRDIGAACGQLGKVGTNQS